MLKYLIVLLDDISISYCHYNNNRRERNLLPIDTLRKGIVFAMKNKLNVHFVYPNYVLPVEYDNVLNTVEHTNIKPKDYAEDSDIIVLDKCDSLDGITPKTNSVYILHVSKDELFSHSNEIAMAFSSLPRLNIILTDVESFSEEDFCKYKSVLTQFAKAIVNSFRENKFHQLNTLTDRMILSKMNNCGAGDTNVTLAPNGKFYICPAFYYEKEEDNIGDLEHGLNIKNKQLYRLDYAPICSHCDAWQCKRCVWLNRKMTLEVNTPSHEQCVVAHMERNASRDLLEVLRKQNPTFRDLPEIEAIDYLDPFDNRDNW